MPRGLHSLVYSVIPHLKVVVVLYILTEGSTLRRAGRVLSVALGGPHHTRPLSRRGPRVASVPAINQSIWLVGALHPSTHCGAQSAVGRAKKAAIRIGERYATGTTNVFRAGREG